MSASLTAFLYLLSSVCFIMALRGLSSPKSARMGNIYGIAGMVIAVFTTLALPGVISFGMIVLGVLIGGTIGTVIALRIEMTALPQLVAAFHSLVGFSAVFVAGAAFYAPEAYGIGHAGDIKTASLVEMSIGTAIGAITFTGSSMNSRLTGTIPRPCIAPTAASGTRCITPRSPSSSVSRFWCFPTSSRVYISVC